MKKIIILALDVMKVLFQFITVWDAIKIKKEIKDVLNVVNHLSTIPQNNNVNKLVAFIRKTTLLAINVDLDIICYLI